MCTKQTLKAHDNDKHVSQIRSGGSRELADLLFFQFLATLTNHEPQRLKNGDF